MSESLIQKNIFNSFNRPEPTKGVLDSRLYRNNVGFDEDRKVKYGLCNGSSDLIGVTTIEITQDMVGKKVGVFTAIEVKDKGKKPSDEQKTFIKVIKSLFGFAGVARSNSDVKKIISPKNILKQTSK